MKRTQLRRRTPLARSGPIRRKTRLRARSPKRKPMNAEDRERLAWLRTLPCCAPGAPAGCRFGMTVNHDTHQRGHGQKSSHDRGMPMCWGHHLLDFHEGKGPFAGWSREQRREWQAEMVARYQAMWERRRVNAGCEVT